MDARSCTRRTFIGAGAVAGAGLLLAGCDLFGPAAQTPQGPVTIPAAKLGASGTVVADAGNKVAVVRDDLGIYAISLVCTHLSCTPAFRADIAGDLLPDYDRQARDHFRTTGDQATGGFLCPCHGARFFADSTNFYGPAPRPMDWVKVSYDSAGDLVVDPGTVVVYRDAGDKTAPQWRLDPATKRDNGKTYGV